MSTTTTVTEASPITAQNILRLFPDIDTSSAALDGHDRTVHGAVVDPGVADRGADRNDALVDVGDLHC